MKLCPAEQDRTKAAPWETPSRKHGRPARLISLAWLALLFLAAGAEAHEMYLALDATGQGTYTIQGRFWTPADPSFAWSVISDYDHLPFFIPSLQKSRVEQRSSECIWLKQEAIGRALGVFHRTLHVFLKVCEKPIREITFEDMSHRDFAAYSGSWKIDPAGGGGSWVSYHLVAKPNFFAPTFVARKSFRTSAWDLLFSVESEMVRRGQLSRTLLCCSQTNN